MNATELAALKALVAAEEARQAEPVSSQLSDSPIAPTDGVLPTKEDPMYSWISPNPYRHGHRYRVVFADLQGRRKSITFSTSQEATTWIGNAQKLLVTDGRAIADVITAYLPALAAGDVDGKQRQPQTITTLGYRLRAVIEGRQRVAIETFPWLKAWQETAAKQSRASQSGILAALQAFVAWAGLPAKTLEGIRPRGDKKRGKAQLTIDEGKRFAAEAIAAGDPLAFAAVTMAITGCRAGEVLALQARHVDDGGAVLHVHGTKTDAANRPITIDPAFRPLLLHIAQDKQPLDLLFDFVPERQRTTKDLGKARRDALLRRVRQLCRAAGVPEVVSHSMRGLNATLRKTGGADDSSITRALGHTSFSTTKGSYIAPGVVELVDSQRAHGRLLPSAA